MVPLSSCCDHAHAYAYMHEPYQQHTVACSVINSEQNECAACSHVLDCVAMGLSHSARATTSWASDEVKTNASQWQVINLYQLPEHNAAIHHENAVLQWSCLAARHPPLATPEVWPGGNIART
jgi:hypothetical protein